MNRAESDNESTKVIMNRLSKNDSDLLEQKVKMDSAQSGNGSAKVILIS
jgi:hypothetical protein